MSGMLATGALVAASPVASAGAFVPAAVAAAALVSAVAGGVVAMSAFAAAGVVVADPVAAAGLVPSAFVWDRAVCRRTSPPNRTTIISFFITFVCFSFVSCNFIFALELE